AWRPSDDIVTVAPWHLRRRDCGKGGSAAAEEALMDARGSARGDRYDAKRGRTEPGAPSSKAHCEIELRALGSCLLVTLLGAGTASPFALDRLRVLRLCGDALALRVLCRLAGAALALRRPCRFGGDGFPLDGPCRFRGRLLRLRLPFRFRGEALRLPRRCRFRSKARRLCVLLWLIGGARERRARASLGPRGCRNANNCVNI